MKSKKPIIITAVVTFVVTTAFYLTPIGSFIHDSVSKLTTEQDFYDKIHTMDNLLKTHYINEYDEQKMQDMALTGYAAGVGDPYTNYITKENYDAFIQSMGGDYKGIGVEVINAEDGSIQIVSVVENSPAKKAGLIIDDKIVAVEGEAVTSENYMQMINNIKGVAAAEGDDDVVITVKRGNDIFDLTVVREVLYISTVSSKMLSGGIGYLQITDFGEHTYEEYTEHLLKLEQNNVKGIIIDLRNNPGGMLTSVVSIADTLLPEGNILTIKNKEGKATEYNSNAECIDIPICIIVNGASASASEVLAGAMHDHGKATIVGEKTFGKGVVQSLVEFGDGSAFKFTSAKYYTPSGVCIDGVGISPDVEVALSEEWENTSVSLIPEGEDYQLSVAIDEINKKIN